METLRTEEETLSFPISPLNLDLPESNEIEDNRVYRLPPAPDNTQPVFENLRITVSNPTIQSEPFNRNDPHRIVHPRGGSRWTRYWPNFKKK